MLIILLAGKERTTEQTGRSFIRQLLLRIPPTLKKGRPSKHSRTPHSKPTAPVACTATSQSLGGTYVGRHHWYLPRLPVRVEGLRQFRRFYVEGAADSIAAWVFWSPFWVLISAPLGSALGLP